MTVLLDFPANSTKQIDQAQIESTVQATLDHQRISTKSDLTVAIVDDARIQQLNRDFLGVDAPTDVLAFPAGHIDPDTNQSYLGDVIISYPAASRQAEQAKHPTSDEIRLLVVHGVLHLIGHDHLKPEEKSKMWSAQNEILESLGLDIKTPDFSNENDG